MTEWSVAITVGRPAGGDVEAEAGEVVAALGEFAPAVSVGRGDATIRLALAGNTVRDALSRALVEVRGAVEAVGWPPGVRHVEATEWGEFEKRLEAPALPELVGVTEIAELLGTSRQRASELARSPKFPAPLADLAAGPVWPKPVVARFAEEWERKPGRPRSKTSERLDQIIEDRRAREVEGTRER
ncbi:MAG TPA: hypothetical protein VEV43_06825 [Actinomycetota bacterium]|nr:hypothetical protein [Actinomycetota bacterium]